MRCVEPWILELKYERNYMIKEKCSAFRRNLDSDDFDYRHMDLCSECNTWYFKRELKRRGVSLQGFPCVHIGYYATYETHDCLDISTCPEILIAKSGNRFCLPNRDKTRSGIVIKYCPWCAHGLSIPRVKVDSHSTANFSKLANKVSSKQSQRYRAYQPAIKIDSGAMSEFSLVLESVPTYYNEFIRAQLSPRKIRLSSYPCIHMAYLSTTISKRASDPWTDDGPPILRLKGHTYGIPIRDGGSSFVAIRYCPLCSIELKKR